MVAQATMIDKTHSSVSTTIRTLAALRELIRALDRRDLHVERASETGIARDARLLRRQALARIEELQTAGSDRERYDKTRTPAPAEGSANKAAFRP